MARLRPCLFSWLERCAARVRLCADCCTWEIQTFPDMGNMGFDGRPGKLARGKGLRLWLSGRKVQPVLVRQVHNPPALKEAADFAITFTVLSTSVDPPFLAERLHHLSLISLPHRLFSVAPEMGPLFFWPGKRQATAGGEAKRRPSAR